MALVWWSALLAGRADGTRRIERPTGTLRSVGDGLTDPTFRFAELLRAPEAAVPLDEACLLIAAHADADLDVDTELGRLDDLAEGLEPTLDGLRRRLFEDLGFTGDRQLYYDPRNSYLHEVVRRRRGIPITLSVLTLSVGRRVGVPLAGVGMPGHFLLRDRVDPDVFLDPFVGGVLLDSAGCERAFRAVQGPEADFDPAFLEPVGTHAILGRVLANLRAVFAARGEHRSLTWVLRLRTLVPGSPVDDRAELATALAAVGDLVGAARELEDLAGVVGGALGEDLERRACLLRARLN